MSNTLTYDDEKINIQLERSEMNQIEITITKKRKGGINGDQIMTLQGDPAIRLRDFLIQNI